MPRTARRQWLCWQRLLPGAFLDLAHLQNWNYELKDGILTMARDKAKIQIVAATGRLIEADAHLPFGHIQIHTKPEALATNINDLELNAYMINFSDPTRPIGSSVAFTAQALCRTSLLSRRHLSSASIWRRSFSRVLTLAVLIRWIICWT